MIFPLVIHRHITTHKRRKRRVIFVAYIPAFRDEACWVWHQFFAELVCILLTSAATIPPPRTLLFTDRNLHCPIM